MKRSWQYRLARMMLPGLKRWILAIFFGIAAIVLGVFLLLGYHPITVSGIFVRELLEHAADVLPYRISGFVVILAGALLIGLAVARVTILVLGAYLPADRAPISEVLYRRRHLDRGPKVVVIGGGTGLANLLRGLKAFTNNITAVVTVGDDGGSSGRLRQELGVLPPGDIRNCIAALADEEQLVTALFQYRFASGQGLEGHSFGNLFLSALCALTDGDMLQAVKVASRVLNSCGQVLPSTLTPIKLAAELTDGRVIVGESRITQARGQIKVMRTEPALPEPTAEVLQAIEAAEVIVLGPGSLYTSVIPNLLVAGIPDAIRASQSRKIYICNVMTQPGETTGYSVFDHVQSILDHACHGVLSGSLIEAVIVNDELPVVSSEAKSVPVRLDAERGRKLHIKIIRRPLVSHEHNWRHDPYKLARSILYWSYRQKRWSVLNPRRARVAASL